MTSAVPRLPVKPCLGAARYRAAELPVPGISMSLFHASDRISPGLDRQAAGIRLLPLLYGLTLFVSALLLFSIQPMFAKMVLPKLGGAPAVWSVAMVFFQTTLLAGYAYAHVLNRTLRSRRAAMLHLVLVGVTAMALPIAVAPGWSAPPPDGAALWLFGLFAISIGLPFFTLSASAPLLQSWFAASGHRQAGNPYVLYAASNLGSFAALFAYPVVIEPFLTLKAQTAAWSFGFALFAVLLAVASLFTSGAAPVAAQAAPQDEVRASAIERMRWIALAAVPSGLVIAVTAYLTTDIAAAPFLWVLPLAIYLLTFVAAFRERPWIAHANVVRFVPFAVAPLAVSLIGGDKVFWLTMIALNLVAFALLTLMCHGELYATPAEPAAVDGVLPLHLVRRGDWRSVCGPAGAADIQRQLRIPDPGRAGGAVHARNLRRRHPQGGGRTLAVAAAERGPGTGLVAHPSAAACDPGAAVSSAARAAGGRDAVSAAAADALLWARRPEFCYHRLVAPRNSADRDGPQFLRRPQGGRSCRRQGPHPLSRHHDPRGSAVA